MCSQKPTKGHQNVAKAFVCPPAKVSFPTQSLFALALYKNKALLTLCLMIFVLVKKQNISILVDVCHFCSEYYSYSAALPKRFFFKEVPPR